MKNDFAWAAENRDRILAEWSQALRRQVRAQELSRVAPVAMGPGLVYLRIRGVDQALRRLHGTGRNRTGGWGGRVRRPSSAPRAAARPRCSGPLPASMCRARGRSSRRAGTSRPCRSAPATSGSSSSPTRCSPTSPIRDNVGYGLVSHGRAPGRDRGPGAELLELVGLPEQARKYPAQLSGGQQQRVALARALALRPGLLLLDEPLSALDARVRARLRGELRDLQRRLGVTTIMVTHDQEEALTMSDRIVVMRAGHVEQVGKPARDLCQPGHTLRRRLRRQDELPGRPPDRPAPGRRRRCRAGAWGTCGRAWRPAPTSPSACGRRTSWCARPPAGQRNVVQAEVVGPRVRGQPYRGHPPGTGHVFLRGGRPLAQRRPRPGIERGRPLPIACCRPSVCTSSPASRRQPEAAMAARPYRPADVPAATVGRDDRARGAASRRPLPALQSRRPRVTARLWPSSCRWSRCWRRASRGRTAASPGSPTSGVSSPTRRWRARSPTASSSQRSAP